MINKKNSNKTWFLFFILIISVLIIGVIFLFYLIINGFNNILSNNEKIVAFFKKISTGPFIIYLYFKIKEIYLYVKNKKEFKLSMLLQDSILSINDIIILIIVIIIPIILYSVF